MNEVEFQRLQADTDIINADDRRGRFYQDSVQRIMTAWNLDREKAEKLMRKRVERDRKKKIPVDKSIAQFVADVEAAEF